MFVTFIGFSQDKQYIRPGTYEGVIEENSTSYTYYLNVDNEGYVTQMTDTDTTSRVELVLRTYPSKTTTSQGNITNMHWINGGSTWTETQLFILTKVSNSVIVVGHMRYVTNVGSESESWGYMGRGTFYLMD